MMYQRARGTITRSSSFDYYAVNGSLSALEEEGQSFLARAGIPPDMTNLEFSMAA